MNRAELKQKIDIIVSDRLNYGSLDVMLDEVMDAIFSAMLEPSEAMFDAGKQSRKAGNSVYGNSRSTWQAMLSASPVAPEGGEG